MFNQFNYELCKNFEVEYFSVQSKKFYLENRFYTGYGIRIHTYHGDFDIDDICINKNDIDNLVDILNNENILLIHIENIIEDFINQLNTLCCIS